LTNRARLVKSAAFSLRHGWRRHFSMQASRVGQFGVPGLFSPQYFETMKQDSQKRCNALLDQLSTMPPSLQVLKAIDEISNDLCSVLDSAELCRSVHPDSSWSEAADAAYADMSRYMEQLNTHAGIYEALVRVTSDDALMRSFSEEQKKVARHLQREMETRGIGLPDELKHKALDLHDEMSRLCSQFLRHIMVENESVRIENLWALTNLPSSALHRVKRSADGKAAMLPLESDLVATVLKWVSDESVRQAVYTASHRSKASQANLPVLDKLIQVRHELATLVGFPSYAAYQTADKILESPERVKAFLSSLTGAVGHRAADELDIIRNIKRSEGFSSDVQAWDVPYYQGKLKARHFNLDAGTISEYLSIQNCLQGLELVVSTLFQLRLEAVEMPPEEQWAPDVTKILVRDQITSKVLGVVYLDLFQRANKFDGSACFTIQCGRTLPDGSRQLPIIALVTSFSAPEDDTEDTEDLCLLSQGQMETLFHEFGHAMHHVLSQTEFQHLAGTRAPLDIAEIPSHMMEYFCMDYRVLSRFARHYQTGEPIPQEMAENIIRSDTMFFGMDTQQQALYALADQEIFSESVGSGLVSATQAIQQLQANHTLIPYVPDTYWHAKFSHFTNYAGGYYSYLFCKAACASIWKHCFAEHPLDPAMGQKYRHELLAHGGARDSMSMIKALTGQDQVSVSDYLEAKKALPAVATETKAHIVSRDQY